MLLNRLKKVQSKKKERAAVEDAVRAEEAALAEEIGHEGQTFHLQLIRIIITNA